MRLATDAAVTGDVGIVGFGARVGWMALFALCSATNGTLDSFAVEPAAAPDEAEGFITVDMPTAASVCARPCLAANTAVDPFAMEAAAAPNGEGVIASITPTATGVCGAKGVTTVGMQGTGLLRLCSMTARNDMR